MKKLTLLIVTTLVTVAASGGCRTCGSPFSYFNRGDSCSTCGTGNSDSYGASYGSSYGTPYDSGMVYQGDTMLPPVSGELLPGPQPVGR